MTQGPNELPPSEVNLPPPPAAYKLSITQVSSFVLFSFRKLCSLNRQCRRPRALLSASPDPQSALRVVGDPGRSNLDVDDPASESECSAAASPARLVGNRRAGVFRSDGTPRASPVGRPEMDRRGARRQHRSGLAGRATTTVSGPGLPNEAGRHNDGREGAGTRPTVEGDRGAGRRRGCDPRSSRTVHHEVRAAAATGAGPRNLAPAQDLRASCSRIELFCSSSLRLPSAISSSRVWTASMRSKACWSVV